MELTEGIKQSLLLIFILYLLFHQDAATRCFQCLNIPYPRACTKLVECNPDEHCFTEQIVTSSGTVVYNSGCLIQQRCNLVSDEISRRRSSNITVRSSTDISTCVQCCNEDYCNNEGCGTKALPRDQRGPYCFHCDSVLDPNKCSNAAVCLQDEVCLLHSPSDLAGLPETVYRSSCARQSKCNELLNTDGRTKCTPNCCKTDFCNNECGIPQINNTTTTVLTPTYSSPRTTTEVLSISTTQKPTCTSAVHHNHNQCNSDGYSVITADKHTKLCIHIVKAHATWDEARTRCKAENGDLLVVDNNHKANLLRHTLEQSHFTHTSFWIGARDFEETRQFSWVDCTELVDSRADWDVSKPSFSRHIARDCVATNNPNFKWHNRNCSVPISFICERK